MTERDAVGAESFGTSSVRTRRPRLKRLEGRHVAVESCAEAIELRAGETTTPCPFLKTVDAEPHLVYPHRINCEHRRGAARALSADQLAWFCINGGYHCCPTYRLSLERGGVS